MKAKIGIGRKWAHLEVIGEDVEQVERKTSDDGSCSVVENRACWILKCSCGMKFNLPKREWFGVRYMKDCGCGVSADDGATVIITASVPAKLKIRLAQYASKNRVSFSYALRESSAIGLEMLENAENQTDNE